MVSSEDGICCVTFKQKLGGKGHYSSESCLNVQDVVDSSSVNVDFASEYNLQVKSEEGFDDDPREHNLKQECLNSYIKQLKKEDTFVNMPVNVTDDTKDGIHRATLKQEPEDLEFQVDIEEHYSSESCSDVKEDMHSTLIELDFANEHNSQVKNEASCHDGPRICNLKQDAVECDTKRPENEIDSYNSVQINIKINSCDEIQVSEEQFHKSLDNKGETHSSSNNFQNHSMKVHSETKKELFQCYFCEYNSNNKSNLGRHIHYKHNKRLKESPKIYQCPFCEHKSKYKHHLKGHIDYKHNENPKWYQCSFCNYKTKFKHVLIYHFKVKHDENSEMQHCQFCEYKSMSKSSLERHINCKHKENPRWYQCSSCDYKAKCRPSLAYHVKVHHDENSKVHHCQFCQYKSKNNSKLERHINCNHNKNAKWFQCNSCIYKTKDEFNLKRHIEYKHNIRLKGSSEMYQCQFCEYKTIYKYHLKDHIDCKHNENPKWYQCSSCDYKAKIKSYLNKHLTRRHNKD